MTEDSEQRAASSEQLPEAIAEATAEQPGVRAALGVALRGGPAHAYSFVGPTGSGKAAAARAFAAEIPAIGAGDPDDARRRALADPSPHPDLTRLVPPGNQHLVEDVRREVIGAVAYRPFEGGRRVFVIAAADAMAEESQNALLKTLEEPPGYAHLILITAEPAGLLETVRSRLTAVGFQPLPPAAPGAAARRRPPRPLGAGDRRAGGAGRRRPRPGPPARLAGRRPPPRKRRGRRSSGDRRRSRRRPWAELLELAAERGKERERAALGEAAAERAAEFGKGRDATRIRRDGEDAGKRADRRARTEAIDLGLALVAAWYADLAAIGEDAAEVVRNRDRSDRLEADAARVDPVAARRAAEVAMATRRRLQVNVNEDLALDALFHRAAALLDDAGAVV